MRDFFRGLLAEGLGGHAVLVDNRLADERVDGLFSDIVGSCRCVGTGRPHLLF